MKLPKYKNKGFWGGEYGHVHALQEFGVWAVLIGLAAWAISPILSAAIAVFLMLKASSYWIAREVKQSKAQGRKPIDKLDEVQEPNKPNRFWTQDAIDDVEFPRKLRPLWIVLSGAFIYWMFTQTGFVGLLLDLLIARFF